MLLALAVTAALAADPQVEDQIHRHRTVGTASLVGGTAATAGGLAVLLVGRGRPGELSEESQAVSDLRSIGGSALMIGGFTVALVGGAELGKARTLERGPSAVALVLPGGAGFAVAGAF